MTEIDSIRIVPGSPWRVRLDMGDGTCYWHAIGDPVQFLHETQRVLGPWVAEDRLIQAMYAEPPEPQSIRADLEENV